MRRSKRSIRKRAGIEVEVTPSNGDMGKDDDEGWSFQRLLRIVHAISAEYSRFQQGSSPSYSGYHPLRELNEAVQGTNDTYSYSNGSRRYNSALKECKTAETNDAIGTALLGVHTYLMQLRDEGWLLNASRGTLEKPEVPNDNSKIRIGAVKERLCRICLADFKVGEMITKLPCDHFFHRYCCTL